MQTVLLLILTAIFYTAFYAFVNKANAAGNGYVATFIFSVLAGIGSLLAYGYMRQAKKIVALASTPASIGYALAAGVSLAFVSVLILLIFTRGAGLSYAIPVIYGGTVVLATFVGWLLFQEQISLLQAVGTGVVICGLGLIIASKV